MLTFRSPLISEADDLTDLCIRSKAKCGYDQTFMDACRAELTITPERIRGSTMQVGEKGGRLVGVAQVSLQAASDSQVPSPIHMASTNGNTSRYPLVITRETRAAIEGPGDPAATSSALAKMSREVES